MPRVLLYLMLSVPLLTPPGFCLCHLGEPDHNCAADRSAPGDDHEGDDPNCPCHNADAFVRGFLPDGSVSVDGPMALPMTAIPMLVAAERTKARPDRDNVPIFPTPPRCVVYRSLLI